MNQTQLGEVTFCGYTLRQWLELKDTLETANLRVDQTEELARMLKERDHLLKKAPSANPTIPEDLDERISVAVARGVADANTEELNENLALRAENERLLALLKAIEGAVSQYHYDGTEF